MGERNTAAPDWEVLSMSSMSASTFANPNPNPSCAKTCKSLFRYPVLDDSSNPNPSAEYGSALDASNWTHPFQEGATGDDGAYKIVAVHLPQQSAPSHLHVHDGGHGYGEEEIGYLDLDAESLLQTEPFMAASQKLTIEAAEALVGISSTNMGADQAPKKKARQAPKKKARRSRTAKVVWTIAVAATIVGIVMLQRRLQAELYQSQQLQLERSIKDEKLDDLTRQVSSLKEVLNRHYTARRSFF